MSNEREIASRDLEIINGAPVSGVARTPVEMLIEHLEARDTFDDFPDDLPTAARRVP